MQDQDTPSYLPGTNRPKQLRSACDSCHQQKIRCSGGGSICARCQKHHLACHYSEMGRLGKPKGSKNKKTRERERQHSTASQGGSVESSSSSQQLSGWQNSETAGQAPLGEEIEIDAFMTSPTQLASPSFSPYPPGNILDNHSFNGVTSDPMGREFDVDFNAVLSEPSNHQFTMSGTRSLDETMDGKLYNSLFHEANILLPSESHSLLTPPSSLALDPARTSRSHRREAGLAIFANLESKVSREENSGCNCLQLQANLLCGIRPSDQAEQVDSLLRSSGSTFPVLERSLQCTRCLSDSQVMQMCSMVLKNLLRWVNTVYSSREEVHMRIGDYRPNEEERACIYSALLLRLLARFKSLLALFEKRIDRIRVAGECERDDTDFLNHTVVSLSRSVNALVQDLRSSLDLE